MIYEEQYDNVLFINIESIFKFVDGAKKHQVILITDYILS